MKNPSVRNKRNTRRPRAMLRPRLQRRGRTKEVKGNKMKTKVETKNKGKKVEIAEAICKKDCPFHGSLKFRGRAFEGKVTSKFPKRIAIELERMVYVRKYERYTKSKTKIHARLPGCMEKEINVGDFVRIQECRPLSKIIHFVVVKKINDKEDGK